MKSLWPALWLITGLTPRCPRVDRTTPSSSPTAGPRAAPLTARFAFPLTDIPLIWASEWAFQIDPSEDSSLRAACKAIPEHSGLSITGKFHSSLLIVSWPERVCHRLQSLCARCHCHTINTSVIPNRGQIVFCRRRLSWILNCTIADAAPSCFFFLFCL